MPPSVQDQGILPGYPRGPLAVMGLIRFVSNARLFLVPLLHRGVTRACLSHLHRIPTAAWVCWHPLSTDVHVVSRRRDDRVSCPSVRSNQGRFWLSPDAAGTANTTHKGTALPLLLRAVNGEFALEAQLDFAPKVRPRRLQYVYRSGG